MTCVVPSEYKNAQTFTTLIVTPKKNYLSSKFLNQTMHSDNKSSATNRLVTGGGKGNLNSTALKTYPMFCPSFKEQEKIASFLTSVDTKIEQLTKKEALLSSYKNGVMQKIFSGEIRFKADDGNEWLSGVLQDVHPENLAGGSTEGNLGTNEILTKAQASPFKSLRPSV